MVLYEDTPRKYFNEYNILTIHNIIALNALVMLNKIRSFPSLLPNSIVATIPTYSPEHGTTHDDCEKWLKTYNTPTYRNSLFFKGPLLYSTTNFVEIFQYKANYYSKYIQKQSKESNFGLSRGRRNHRMGGG